MDGSELFEKCLEQATTIVKQVRPEQMAGPTPDTDWNVRDLAEHMLYELLWVPEMVEGLTISEVGDKYEGDLIDDGAHDLSVKWDQATVRAYMAANAADPEETAHLSFDDVSVDNYLKQVGGDLLIHAWDLAKAINFPIRFEPTVAQNVYNDTLDRTASLAASGLFAPPIKVSTTADLQTRLLALFGRHADWAAH